MLLLYCKDAIVLNIHDDTAPAVPKSGYGDGVRIIPWSGLIGDLQKVGSPPSPPFIDGSRNPDTRPWAQPTETPAILLGYAAQVRYETSTKTLNFTTSASATIPLNTDRISQTLINNLAAYARTLAPTDPVSFTQDNIAYDITAQDAINISAAIAEQIQAARDVEANLIADLKSPTPTTKTYDDVDAAFASLRGVKQRSSDAARETREHRS